METTLTSRPQAIQDNLDYTLFSWSKQGGLNPMHIDRAKGVYLWDNNGKRYIDFSSQLMNCNIGHGDQRITKAVVEQMEKVAFVQPGMTTDVRGALGRKLAEITPGNLTKSFFTLGGSEAIENAVKVARFYTGRHKIITQYRSYHGATAVAITASGDPRRFPVDNTAAPGFVRVENPYFYRCPWNSRSFEECGEMALRNLEQVMKYENPDSIAAVLFEGESGSSGCLKYPPFYLKGVKALCEKYGILFIADEVMSGFGRTGKMFAVEHHEVEPDIMCMAKGITSGYIALGATVVTDTIAKKFDDAMLAIGLTYSAHAVACAAAIANIQVLQEEGMVENAARMGRYIEQRANEMKEKHPSIGDFRTTGLLGCFELVKDRKTREPIAPWNAKPQDMEISNKIAASLRANGMFTFVRWNWIFTAPPLCVTEEQIGEGLEIISKGIAIADGYYTG
jgi:taurine---2-oxoglutarate transaminase